ncbi:MAG: hypothetical protein WD875_00320 [Pirellulales bacterium]
MSAEVEIVMARHENVVAVPVAAVVEHEKKFSCWVKDGEGCARRWLELGDTNDQFIVVEAGLKEDDEVVLNPLAFIDDAQREAMKPLGESQDESNGKAKPDAKADAAESKQPGEDAASPDAAAKPSSDAKGGSGKPAKISGEQLVKLADKNGDGVLTIDEYAEKDRQHFAATDANGDGKVDASEAQAAIERFLGAKQQ